MNAETASGDSPDPSKDVHEWMSSLSNWGRWGTDDEKGTLNLIDADARRRGAQLVTSGHVVSLASDIRTSGSEAQRYMIGTGLERDHDDEAVTRPGGGDHNHTGIAAEFLGLIYHGLSMTHIDAPSHVFWDGKMYNDRSASLVTDRHGATKNDVRAAGDGIVTRGVLIDVAGQRDLDSLPPSEPIYPHDLDAALDATDIQMAPGDVLLVRTGEASRRRAAGANYKGSTQPGIHATCLPWLHQRGIATLGSDVAQDVRPSGCAEFSMPIHTVGLVAMGLWLVDNCDLDELAAYCRKIGRYEFQFVLAPLRFRGATGSPANPLAIF
jgi:kynurenine formamidase